MKEVRLEHKRRSKPKMHPSHKRGEYLKLTIKNLDRESSFLETRKEFLRTAIFLPSNWKNEESCIEHEILVFARALAFTRTKLLTHISKEHSRLNG